MRTKERFDLIIFDCDGTLVDSEVLNIAAVSRTLGECGLEEYSEERLFNDFSGWRFSAILNKISENTGYIFPENIVERFVNHVHDMAPEKMRLIEGVAETVQCAQGFAKTCVVSNGQLDNIVNSLKFAGLLRFFPKESIICATVDMAIRPKPAPDLFLMAAEKAGVAADKTLVIEDSKTGISAAIAANMSAWGFCETHPTSEKHAKELLALGAGKVFFNMKELREALED